MQRDSPTSRPRGSRGLMPRAVVAGMTMMALLGAFTGGPVRAADPDFTNVSDILGGKRYLLRQDDLVFTSTQVGTSQHQTAGATLYSANSTLAFRQTVPWGVAGGGVNFAQGNSRTAVGRMFTLPYDVVPGLTSGAASLAAGRFGATDHDQLVVSYQPASGGAIVATVDFDASLHPSLKAKAQGLTASAGFVKAGRLDWFSPYDYAVFVGGNDIQILNFTTDGNLTPGIRGPGLPITTTWASTDSPSSSARSHASGRAYRQAWSRRSPSLCRR